MSLQRAGKEQKTKSSALEELMALREKKGLATHKSAAKKKKGRRDEDDDEEEDEDAVVRRCVLHHMKTSY
eukprot:9095880-Pyramimonas_sp.AAC.1